MKIGFIGTGKITAAVITGIFKSKLAPINITISPRNKETAKKLKNRFNSIKIAKNNQEVINASDWIFLSVTPNVGKEIIKDLNFKSNQTVISFISTINLAQLKKAIKVKVKLVRAIPLPPIALGKGPVPICPPNKSVRNFFNKIGTVIEIKKEVSSINFWATSGIMASFYELLRVMSDWLVKKGVKRSNAQKYIASLFLALSEDAVLNSNKDLKYLVKDSQTPGGLNEQGVKELIRSGFYKKLEKTLNNIHKRVNK